MDKLLDTKKTGVYSTDELGEAINMLARRYQKLIDYKDTTPEDQIDEEVAAIALDLFSVFATQVRDAYDIKIDVKYNPYHVDGITGGVFYDVQNKIEDNEGEFRYKAHVYLPNRGNEAKRIWLKDDTDYHGIKCDIEDAECED